MLKKIDGSHGGGYSYQWLAVLYVILDVKLYFESSRQSEITKFLNKQINLDEAIIKFEGTNQDNEDFELYLINESGEYNRIIFQVKTKSENTGQFNLTSSEIKSALKNFYDKNSTSIKSFTIITDTGIKNNSEYSQAFPVNFLSSYRKDEIIDFKTKFNDEYKVDISDEFLSKVFIWHLPIYYHLQSFLYSQSFLDKEIINSLYIKVMDSSIAKNGSAININKIIGEIKEQSIIKKIKYNEKINKKFEADYLANNFLNKNNIKQFINRFYVKRQFDKKINNIDNKIDLNEIINKLKSIIKFIKADMIKDATCSDKEIKKCHENLAEICERIIEEIELDISPKMIYLTIKENVVDIENCIKKFRASKLKGYLKIIIEICELLNGYKNVILLVGNTGSGKTLAIYKYACKFDWFYIFKLGNYNLNLEDCFKECSKELSDEKIFFLEHITALAKNMPDGMVIFDGIEEAADFNDNNLLKFIKDLTLISGNKIKYAITCRSDYLEHITAFWRDPQKRFDWETNLDEYTDLIEVTEMNCENPILWLENYCKCFEIDLNYLSKAMSLLNKRYSPRNLQHIFYTLKNYISNGSELPEELVFSDILYIYSNYVCNDCNTRQEFKTTIDQTYNEIYKLSLFYWQIYDKNKKNHHNHLVNIEIIKNLYQNILDALIKCHELIIVANTVEWFVADFSFFVSAREIFNNNHPISKDNFYAISKKITDDFHQNACDVIIHLFYNMYIFNKYNKKFILKSYNTGYNDNKFYDEILSTLSKNSYEYIALQIFMFIESNKVSELEIDIKFDDNIFDNISIECIYIFLDGLIKSSLIDFNKGLKDAKDYVIRYKNFLTQILRLYSKFDFYIYEQYTTNFLKEILFNYTSSKEFLLKNISLIDLLCETYSSSYLITDLVYKWVKESVNNIDDIETFDDIMFYIGNLKRNKRLEELSKLIAIKIVDNKKFSTWIVNDDIKIFKTNSYYPRKDVINVYIKKDKPLGDLLNIYNVLIKGNKEQRRNAIFMIQKKLELAPVFLKVKYFINFITGEDDIELLSTCFGIIFNERYSPNENTKNNYVEVYNRLLDEKTKLKEICVQFNDLLQDISTLNDYVKFLVENRGIIEIIEVCKINFINKLKEIEDNNLSMENSCLLKNTFDSEINMLNVRQIINDILTKSGCRI